ncbi:MAG: tryptophan halogenase family protein [Myxococcota bacterium]
MHTEPVKSILVVGGGSAGWMSACYLKKSFPDIDVTLIEAPTVPRIGVGEATIPNLQTAFWDHLGIPEEEWMKSVNASFKMGIKFVDWSRNPDPDRDDYYYHLFGVMPECDGVPLSHYWVKNRLLGGEGERLDYACYKEPMMTDAAVSPRYLDGRRAAHYAWHFDVQKMAAFLQKVSEDLGVKYQTGYVESVSQNERGFITDVKTRDGRTLSADMFIDCTGFRSVLLGKMLGEEFIDMSDQLLCDSAVATRLPYNERNTGPVPYTTATALRAGWCWNIPLLDRFGTGYVHSSDHTTMDEAVEEFAGHLGVDPDKQEWRKIRFRVGRMKRSWVKNCVAIGLSSNFLEPLESTSLYLTYGALYQLCRFFPDRSFSPALAEQFNNEIAYGYDDCKDFVQMHYITTRRDDTSFWRACQTDLKVSERLQEKLRMYKAGLPINSLSSSSSHYYTNFELEYRNFWTNGNYYSVLTGMGVYPDSVYSRLLYRSRSEEQASQMFKRIRAQGRQLASSLPPNDVFLRALHAKDSRIVFTN